MAQEHFPPIPPGSHDGEAQEAIIRKIRHGWIAALFTAVFTLGFTVYTIQRNIPGGLPDVAGLIEVGFIFLLAFGIYKRSRTAATLMLVYFLSMRILMMLHFGEVTGMAGTLLFGYFFGRAAIGTFQYHRCLESRRQ
jgi:hypothetical protein